MNWDDYKLPVDQLMGTANTVETSFEEEDLCDLVANLDNLKSDVDDLIRMLEDEPEYQECD